MSRLTRALVLGAMLAAMTLTATAAVAQAQPSAGDAARLACQDTRASHDPARCQALAQEHYYSTWGYADPAAEQALAQERYYNTWRISEQSTGSAQPAPSSRQPGWHVLAPSVAAALALAGALAAMTARRTRRRVRARQAA